MRRHRLTRTTTNILSPRWHQSGTVAKKRCSPMVQKRTPESSFACEGARCNVQQWLARACGMCFKCFSGVRSVVYSSATRGDGVGVCIENSSGPARKGNATGIDLPSDASAALEAEAAGKGCKAHDNDRAMASCDRHASCIFTRRAHRRNVFAEGCRGLATFRFL